MSRQWEKVKFLACSASHRKIVTDFFLSLFSLAATNATHCFFQKIIANIAERMKKIDITLLAGAYQLLYIIVMIGLIKDTCVAPFITIIYVHYAYNFSSISGF